MISLGIGAVGIIVEALIQALFSLDSKHIVQAGSEEGDQWLYT